MQVMDIVLFVYALVVVGLVWFLIVNTITHRHRIHIIGAVFDRVDYRPYLRAYEQVTYESHLWRLFFLRSPWALYSADLRAMHIMRYVDPGHPSRLLLRHLASVHPDTARTATLIDCCGYTGNAPAALAWHVMRVNDSLPLVGWKIDVAGDRHSLVPISESWFLKLVERYERRRRVA